MLDFLLIATRIPKNGVVEVYPKFIIKKSSDLMIRGGDFYAIWLSNLNVWSTDEQDALRMIDLELDAYADEYRRSGAVDANVRVLHMWDSENGMIDRWHRYCQKHMRDNFHMLDERLIFANTNVSKEDYSSKHLSYPLERGSIAAYDRLMSTLYSEEERRKIEWAIGSIVSGDSVNIQKFMVLYGAAGTGKSTVLNIIQMLFEGYYSVFDAKALGSSNNSFALESFKTYPLVAIQHDGDLSHIEDNTRLNSLVSHEIMTVNEKFKSAYSARFRSFLFMGTNKPVKITDAKSGLIRRLIDVSPTGDKVPSDEYRQIMHQVTFELGGIATHCLDVYQQDPNYYDNYIPTNMMGASNDFYNFMENAYFMFKEEDGVSLRKAWDMYRTYCEDAKVAYPYSMRAFKEELKNYFTSYFERYTDKDGNRIRSYYSGFAFSKFENFDSEPMSKNSDTNWLILKKQPSLLDDVLSDCPAQYGPEENGFMKYWSNVDTCLRDLDTGKTHFVKIPDISHIVVDFDIKDESGKKSLGLNLNEASKWPPTYAELSNSGQGVHLHYIYTGGDPMNLKRDFSKEIEIKVFPGDSSLRRRLTQCNDIPIKTLSSGLPTKGESKRMINQAVIRTERGLRQQIERNLNKEIHKNTTPSISMIAHILDEAYENGVHYDVSDMIDRITRMAARSHHQADNCMKMVANMKFKSDQASDQIMNEVQPIVFFDIEIFPNLFLVCWKFAGEGHDVVALINPSSDDIAEMFNYRLIGFNNRLYDNHILWAAYMGYSVYELYELSKDIITGNKRQGVLFNEAYNISYTDIYDFSSLKQGLKKFEIDLGIHHHELGLPWNEPVPKERWAEVVDYCKDDVLATEATFYSKDRQADFAARKILAEIAHGTPNDTTNTLSTRFIFEGNRNPQSQFNYRKMGEIPEKVFRSTVDVENGVIYNHFGDDEYTLFDENGRPIFPGYVYDPKKKESTYRGEVVSEGGYAYSVPGMYINVALLDIESMHPNSAIAENLFGDYYTKRFKEIVDARLAIKHKDYDKAKSLLNGVLAPYLNDPALIKGLAKALKIVINSVYGLTSASFMNPCKDPRNVDNIVAKRGALFMINLKHEVEKKGFIVAHIKTDSIKIPDATPEIIQFVIDYGRMYGYNFLHEATYDRMCIVNKAVYIARYDTPEAAMTKYGYIPSDLEDHGGEWTATGTQFQIPYVFKRVFTHEPIIFEDLCVTKSVTSAMYLDMNENLPDVSDYVKQLKKELTKETIDGHTMANPDPDASLVSYLQSKIAEGHEYHFVGRVGQFCPVKPGCFGGELVRLNENKANGIKSYDSVTGAKGYRWLESATIKDEHREDDIDMSYFQALADDAIEAVSKYCDYELFVLG